MVTDQNPADEDVAAYLRASTDRQDDDHQRDDIHEWADQHGIDPATITEYVDLARSGSDEEREQFNELIDAIEADKYDRVIVWEISRLARLGSIYQKFFEAAADHQVTINITDGWTDTVRADGTGKLIADISAAVAEEERRKLISRVESGVRRAKAEGKWLGEVPVGFERTEVGYLRPLIDAEEDEDSYLDIRAALEDIDDGMSYNASAKTVNTTRQTLSTIHQDDDRRSWYLNAEAPNDDRVEEALQNVQH